AARRSTWRAARARRRSSRSTPTATRRSSSSPTTASSGTCTRWCPPSRPRSAGRGEARRGGARLALAPGARVSGTVVAAVVLAVLLAACGGLFARRAWLLWRLVRLGKPVERFDDLPARVRAEAEIVLGQRKLFQRLVPGAMHAAIFWGFLVLLPTILIAMIGAVDRESTLPW